ncbi:HK97 gp10 family phage protein [Acinetobacter johnsonii]|uniref:HK97 gp10 family phage protein n=1 Tax=Acinetobacter johnsonii TaxID=40214 RepID=A0AA42IDN1_ACIJO|nr:HK97-gp10 family putative phage morphogenesis protein [Acinetobacter johnsonii]MDH0655941.1 HK97 gp10 family phage protein [Acinetobacter johnsonii]
MDISTKIEGMQDLTSQLEKLETLAKQEKLTQNALFFASKPIVDEIKLKAPVAEKDYYRYYRGSARSRRKGNPQSSRKLIKPGTLKKSVARKRLRLERSVGVGIFIKNKAFYWRFIERGTPNYVAVPFIRPAFDQYKEKSVERFKQRYRKYIEAVVQRHSLESLNVSE